MSKLGEILAVIRNSHVMGKDGLRDYHCAREARDANRCGTTDSRFSAMRKALKNHRVTVSHVFRDGMRTGHIEIRNHETGKNYIAKP